MKRVSILTTSQLKSRLYFFPLRLHAKKLQEAGLSFQYLYRPDPKVFKADQIVIDHHFSRDFWKDNREEMFHFLNKAKKRCQRLLWFDTTASTSILEPEVIPFVDSYYKGLVLKDLDGYTRPLYSNRIFSDYYNKELGVTDALPIEALCVKSKQDTEKIKLSWNYSLAGFFGVRARLLNRLRGLFPLPYHYSIRFTSAKNERPIDISCRIGIDYGRETISYQRKELKRFLEEKYEIDVSRTSLSKYLREIKHAKIALSPFGWGEITYRDFEIIPCGAALMKPEMEHLDTWPALFVKDETYISHRWDLADVEERIKYYLQEKRYAPIAQNAQNLYSKYLYSKEGHDEFVKRVVQIFSSKDN